MSGNKAELRRVTEKQELRQEGRRSKGFARGYGEAGASPWAAVKQGKTTEPDSLHYK